MPKFVVQEHHGRSHHFDFRLERDGAYKSWAVPKGFPEESGINRLAVQVENHDLSSRDFDGRIKLALSGHLLKGPFRLVRSKQSKAREWLFFKLVAKP
jgi:hypothetical protein